MTETLQAPQREQLLPSVTDTAHTDPAAAAAEMSQAVLGFSHADLGIPSNTPVNMGSLDNLDSLNRTTKVPKVSGPTMGDLIRR